MSIRPLSLAFAWVPLAALLVLPCLGTGVGGLSALAAPDDEIVTLEDGEPLEVSLPAGRKRWTARIQVPADVSAMAVVVSGDRDVDGFLRRSRPPGADLVATSDAMAISDAPHEILRIDRETSLRVGPGTWFVTVHDPIPDAKPSAPANGGVSFEVAVFVDRLLGRRTLLPGTPVDVTIPPPGRAFAMRTWLPRRAVGAAVELEPPVLEGLRFRAEGPGGYVRRATTQQRIDLGTEDAPRGVYTLSLSAPVRFRPVPTPTASLTWRFAEGFVLPRPPSPIIELGQSLPVLMGGSANGSVQPVRIAVPEGRGGFVLGATSAAGVNVDLYVRRASPPRRRDEDAQWLGLSVGPSERVVVGGTDELPAGIYHAEILLVEDDRPVEVIVSVHPIPLGEGPSTWGAKSPALLEPNVWVDGVVRVYESAIGWHAVDVPEETETLHVQLLDASGPLELVLVGERDGGIRARALTPLVDEHLDVVFSEPLPETTRYYLGVLNRATWDEEVSYRIAVGFDDGPELPRDMPWPPEAVDHELTPAERTAVATVEITIGDCSGGSGVCVSPGGLILSCRHCLKLKEGVGGLQQDGIIVAFPHAVEAPPVQAFYAKILDEDPERDLVLLGPIRDVFNRPLPDDLTLPYLPLGDSAKLRLGEEVWVGGYPQMGSECTRTAVILSRGIVAGLERRRGGPAWIKTDAWVAPGHSGGPLVDREGRLVGIAAATLGSTESLGLAIPIGRIPASWRERIQARGEPPAGD